jgi:hypothetical protein
VFKSDQQKQCANLPALARSLLPVLIHSVLKPPYGQWLIQVVDFSLFRIAGFAPWAFMLGANSERSAWSPSESLDALLSQLEITRSGALGQS